LLPAVAVISDSMGACLSNAFATLAGSATVLHARPFQCLITDVMAAFSLLCLTVDPIDQCPSERAQHGQATT
jgi:hypothetical protein